MIAVVISNGGLKTENDRKTQDEIRVFSSLKKYNYIEK